MVGGWWSTGFTVTVGLVVQEGVGRGLRNTFFLCTSLAKYNLHFLWKTPLEYLIPCFSLSSLGFRSMLLQLLCAFFFANYNVMVGGWRIDLRARLISECEHIHHHLN